MAKGRCLCGKVSFETDRALEAPSACHCSQCRRQSGHFWSSTELPLSELRLDGAEHLTWYQASEKVRRGFCATCGSFLFWQPLGQDRVAVAMGAFEAPTDTQLSLHIFVADKGDYYDIADGLPQEE